MAVERSLRVSLTRAVSTEAFTAAGAGAGAGVSAAGPAVFSVTAAET